MGATGKWVGMIYGYAYHGEREGTVEMNFPPQPVFASVWLSQTIDDGRSALGIRSLEYLETRDGPGVKLDFGPFFDWPPTWYHPLMTRVTFGVSVYGSTCRGGLALDFWS